MYGAITHDMSESKQQLTSRVTKTSSLTVTHDFISYTT